MMRAQQSFYVITGISTIVLLLVATLTTVLEPLTKVLPSKSHLFVHFIAHAILTITASYALPDHILPELICAVSIAFAFAIELLQAFFVKGRSADIADVAAATIGSFVVFLFPKDGGPPMRPSWNAFTSYFTPDDDDDDDDSHRVNSWAV